MPQNPITSISQGYSYANFSQNATSTLKSGGGILHGYVINTAGNGSTMVLMDGAMVIGTVDTTIVRPIILDIKFNTNLTVQLLGLEAADVTIMYM